MLIADAAEVCSDVGLLLKVTIYGESISAEASTGRQLWGVIPTSSHNLVPLFLCIRLIEGRHLWGNVRLPVMGRFSWTVH